VVDKGKSLEGESSPGAHIVELGQGVNHEGEALSNPIWNRTSPLNPILPGLIWEQALE